MDTNKNIEKKEGYNMQSYVFGDKRGKYLEKKCTEVFIFNKLSFLNKGLTWYCLLNSCRKLSLFDDKNFYLVLCPNNIHS